MCNILKRLGSDTIILVFCLANNRKGRTCLTSEYVQYKSINNDINLSLFLSLSFISHLGKQSACYTDDGRVLTNYLLLINDIKTCNTTNS